eukprot:GSChrysophyteH1.ASY1.ANO1.1708.1 assembled CDS
MHMAFSLVIFLVFAQFHVLRAELEPEWYYDNWCNNEGMKSLQYLDDSLCAKKFPRSSSGFLNIDREWVCSDQQSSTHNITSLLERGYQVDAPLGPQTKVDTTSLLPFMQGIVKAPSQLQLCLIVTKRVEQEKSPLLLHKYFCFGDSSALNAHETWSSSKIFAIANAAGALRTEEPLRQDLSKTRSSCGVDNFGIPSVTQGKHGDTPLGDLATIVCSYDKTSGYSSNSLSSYFHDIGWRSRLDDLVDDCSQGLSGAQSQSLGGNYGEPTPSDLQFSLTDADMHAGEQCSVVKESPVPLLSNILSSLSAAEMLRRIVQIREIPESLRFPGMLWEDAQALLYGQKGGKLFPGLQVGGMSVDPAIFLQAAIPQSSWERIENRDPENWRIFSKLGAGWSSLRAVGEIISIAYGCFPAGAADVDANEASEGANLSTNSSFEFSLSVRGSVPDDQALVGVQAVVLAATRAAVAALLQGKLDV